MKNVFMSLVFIFGATAVWAKAYFAPQTEMISNAQVIAVVNIQSVVTPAGQYAARTSAVVRAMSREGDVACLFPYQVASGTVEKVLKGEPLKSISFRVPSFFPCAVTEVNEGRYIVFLTPVNGVLLGNNWNYAYRPIVDGQVEWYEDKNSLKLTGMPLKTAIRQIVDTIKEQQTGEQKNVPLEHKGAFPTLEQK